MTTPTVQQGGALAGIQSLKQGLVNVKKTLPVTGGGQYMKFSKGDWLYGADETEADIDNTLFAINPLSIEHGYICWAHNDPDDKVAKPELLGEVMVPMTTPKPHVSTLEKFGPRDTWADQISFKMKGIGGKDEGIELEFKTTSVGGLNAVGDVINALIVQLDTDPENPVPVVRLGSDSYNHKKYRKVFIPVITVESWMTMDGPVSGADVGDDADEQAINVATPAPEEPEFGFDPETETEVASKEPPSAGVSGRRRRR